MKKKLVAFFCLLLEASPARIIHIQPDVDEAESLDGESWSTATNLQRGLALAVEGDQLWLKYGVYYPNHGSVFGLRGHYAAFSVRNGIGVFGGFLGTETRLRERPLDSPKQTVLSGDIGKDDVDLDGDRITDSAEGIIGLNSYFVAAMAGVGRDTILDGLTITGGFNEGFNSSRNGGGVVIREGSPTIQRCRFVGNFAEYGGAISCQDSSNAMITNCFFYENSACEGGGGIYVDRSSPWVVNCTFINQLVDGDRDSISCDRNASPLIGNCIFWDRPGRSVRRGPIFVGASSAPLVSHCLITGSGGELDRIEALGIDGGGNLGGDDPWFIEGSFQLRVDSPAVGGGFLAFLPDDLADLDGDGDQFQRIPYDVGGGEMTTFGTPNIDIGCFQYRRFTADSDRDGFRDQFERVVIGDSLLLEPPALASLGMEDGKLILIRQFHSGLRDHGRIILEYRPYFGEASAWREIEATRFYSRRIGADLSEEKHGVSLPQEKGFFRLKVEEM